MTELKLSMAETVILAMSLRVLLEHEVSPKDKEIAEVLMAKLRVSYKGQKVRLILANE